MVIKGLSSWIEPSGCCPNKSYLRQQRCILPEGIFPAEFAGEECRRGNGLLLEEDIGVKNKLLALTGNRN